MQVQGCTADARISASSDGLSSRAGLVLLDGTRIRRLSVFSWYERTLKVRQTRKRGVLVQVWRKPPGHSSFCFAETLGGETSSPHEFSRAAAASDGVNSYERMIKGIHKRTKSPMSSLLVLPCDLGPIDLSRIASKVAIVITKHEATVPTVLTTIRLSLVFAKSAAETLPMFRFAAREAAPALCNN